MPDHALQRFKRWGIRTWLMLAALFFLLSDPGAAQQKQMSPKQMFSKMCAKCHDSDAEGDGPMHSNHLPTPANLTLVRDTPDMAFSIVSNGISGTAMPAFSMPREKFLEVYSWMNQLPPDTTLQWGHPWTPKYEQISEKTGEKIYITACMGCHGKNGGGNGHWADNPHVWPKPANFHARNSEMGRLYYIISNGRTGTMMAPQQRKFPAAARWSLAKYVYSLYDPSGMASIRTPGNESYCPKTGQDRYVPAKQGIRGEGSLTNPFSQSDMQVVKEGHDVFNLYCVACHGGEAKGSFLAPMLIDRIWDYGDGTDGDVFTVVLNGIPGRLMPEHKPLTEDEIWKVITYLRHRGGEPYPLLSPTEAGSHQHE